MLMLMRMSIQVTIHTYNMGRNQTKTCDVCFKSMRSDNFKRHMKKHDWKTEDNIVTKGLHDVKTEDNILTKGPQIRYTDEQFIALKKCKYLKTLGRGYLSEQ